MVDQELHKMCPISQSVLQEDGTSIQNNSLFSSMKLMVEHSSLKEPYILPRTQSEESIDCQMFKICDKYEHIKSFKGIRNVALVFSPLELIQHVPMSNLTMESVFCSYGPVFTRCLIKKEELPVTYHTSILCCIEDENMADALNSEGNIVAKFTEMLRSRFEISLCPLPEKQSSPLPDNDFVKVFDLVKTNIAEDEQTDQNLGCIYQSNKSSRRNIVVTLNLSKLSCDIFSISDERLLWSVEPHTRKQFSEETTSETSEKCSIIVNGKDGILELNSKIEFPVSKFQTVSLYPMTYYHDMSFWEQDGTEFDELVFSDCIRDVAGDNVVSVLFRDGCKDSTSGRQGRCYRLVFQSADKAMSYDTSWGLQSIVRLYVRQKMGITLR